MVRTALSRRTTGMTLIVCGLLIAGAGGLAIAAITASDPGDSTGAASIPPGEVEAAEKMSFEVHHMMRYDTVEFVDAEISSTHMDAGELNQINLIYETNERDAIIVTQSSNSVSPFQPESTDRKELMVDDKEVMVSTTVAGDGSSLGQVSWNDGATWGTATGYEMTGTEVLEFTAFRD